MSEPEDGEAGTYPLSTAQRGIWFAQQLDPGDAIFNIGEYLEIAGPIDAGLFERACRRLIDEHDLYRLAFADTADGPRQWIRPQLDWSLPCIDVSEASDPEAAALAWMRADVARPRRLTRGPLFTLALLRVSDRRSFWYQGYHHLIMDGAGCALAARRLAGIYTALAAGAPVPSSPAPSSLRLLAAENAYRGSPAFLRVGLTGWPSCRRGPRQQPALPAAGPPKPPHPSG